MILSEINPRKAIFITFAVLLLLYFLFQARLLIFGPRLSVLEPLENQALKSPVVTISGQARNAVLLTLDDRQIYTDKEGLWHDKLIASPGLNIIKLVATDRFGRKTEKLIRVVLN
ncbi:hypothetical protein KW785_01450 [Candidatus Parcubacteria bacterium]|nr:hypothetical protein [Candidatus Parcubacteria bacterium]